MDHRFRQLRASQPGEYSEGILIETFGYWNRSEPSWGVAAWEERSLADLCGPFATREEANALLAKEKEYLEYCGYEVVL